MIAGTEQPLCHERHSHGIEEAKLLRQSERRVFRGIKCHCAKVSSFSSVHQHHKKQSQQPVANVGKHVVEVRQHGHGMRAQEIVETQILEKR